MSKMMLKSCTVDGISFMLIVRVGAFFGMFCIQKVQTVLRDSFTSINGTERFTLLLINNKETSIFFLKEKKKALLHI